MEKKQSVNERELLEIKIIIVKSCKNKQKGWNAKSRKSSETLIKSHKVEEKKYSNRIYSEVSTFNYQWEVQNKDLQNKDLPLVVEKEDGERIFINNNIFKNPQRQEGTLSLSIERTEKVPST